MNRLHVYFRPLKINIEEYYMLQRIQRIRAGRYLERKTINNISL